ncbi:MAG: tautomerase family protein [Cyanobacteria bacterium P01_G01_bin.67]
MPQIKIYGLQSNIEPKRFALSHAIQAALTAALGTPEAKRFQRFIMLEPENFIFPSDRTTNYTIIEVIMFEGRSADMKKKLIQLLYQKIQQATDIIPQDLEITILETPRGNWGIRGIPGDELN